MDTEKILKSFGPAILIVIVIAVIGVVFYISQSKKGEEIQVLSSQEVSDKVINFINDNILTGENKASLIDSVSENGLYKIKFKIEGQDTEIEVYASLDGKLFFPNGPIDLAAAEEQNQEEQPAAETGSTIGGFKVSADDVCLKEGKPIVYFFGSKSCPHCVWEHPVVEEVAQRFEGMISFHNNMDSSDDNDIFSKYSTGGIPTLVLGCKYYRVGSGEGSGEEVEAQRLTALICKLTDNKPEAVCSEVQDLINQISE